MIAECKHIVNNVNVTVNGTLRSFFKITAHLRLVFLVMSIIECNKRKIDLEIQIWDEYFYSTLFKTDLQLNRSVRWRIDRCRIGIDIAIFNSLLQMNSVVKQTLPFPGESLWLLWKLLSVLFDHLNSVFLQLVGSLFWNRSHQNDERQRTQWMPFIHAIYHKVEYRWYLVRNNTLPPSFVIHSKKRRKVGA